MLPQQDREGQLALARESPVFDVGRRVTHAERHVARHLRTFVLSLLLFVLRYFVVR